jgi:hypothetical protein
MKNPGRRFGARIILLLVLVLLFRVKPSFGQCKSYIPDQSSFPFTFSQPLMINETLTTPGGTVTQQIFTQPGTNFVGSPYSSYAIVLGSNQAKAFEICSGQPGFSGSGSGSFPATAGSNYYTNVINMSVEDGVFSIHQTGMRTRPLDNGLTYNYYLATFDNTIVYTVQTGAYHVTSKAGGSFSYFDTAGDLIVGTGTSSADISGTWSLTVIPIPPLSIDTFTLPDGKVGFPYSANISASGGVPPYSWSIKFAPPDFSIVTLSSGVGEVLGQDNPLTHYVSLTATVTDTTGTHNSQFYTVAFLPAHGSIFNQSQLEKLREHGGADAENAVMYAILAEAAASNPETFVFVPFFVFLAEHYAEDAGILLALGADPSDPNYKVVALPFFPMTPQATAQAGITQDEANALNALLENLDKVSAYGNAAVTATNRAHGAQDAGDVYWQQTQLAAVKFYSFNLANLLATQPALRSNLESAFVKAGLPAIQITQQMISSFENSTAQNGLPKDFVQGLSNLGANADTIALAQQFLSFPTGSPSTFPSDIINPDLDNDDAALSVSLLQFAADRNADGSVNCVDLDIVRASFGKKTGQVGFDPRVLCAYNCLNKNH